MRTRTKATHDAADTTDATISRLRETAAVDRVFGAPIERDGTTVVPVASVRSAARGARGRRGHGGSNKGGAMATNARPAGVYLIRKGRVRWRPAVNVTRLFVVGNLTAVAYFVFAWLSARAARSDVPDV